MQVTQVIKEPIIFKDSLTAFLDILGFKQMVNAAKVEDVESIEKYFGVIDNMRSRLMHLSSNIDLVNISDSIVVSIPIRNDEEPGTKLSKFVFLCAILADAQLELSCMNIWFRGSYLIW